ncbi:MAG TPA: FkbM family methyltransferase [Stellaceae bacterium]|nr:FkbM family methyltransferase [Stellaceae bacterium]
MSAPISLRLSLRQPAQIEISSPLARGVLRLGERGSRRLRRKLVRSAFSLVHRRLGLPARAVMRLENGTQFPVDCADTAFLDFAARLARDGAVEPEVTALFTHLAPRLSVVYDIGANWGYYPLLLGTDPRFKGEIHAFEIAPRTAEGLGRLVRSAGIEARVRVHRYGLWRLDGEVRLTRERHSYLARIVAEEYRGGSDRVPVRRLDGLDLPAPDLIKIDVEGHETDVLLGGLELVRRRHPMIVFESWFDAENRGTMLAPLELLEGSGYALFRPTWHPAAAAAEGRLDLEPLAAAARPAIALSLNLVAVHPAQAASLPAP